MSLRSRILWLERSQETAQRFQGLFDAVFEGIVVHEFGIILEANESFAKIFGYAEEDVVGRPILDFIAPEWRDFALAQVRAQIETPYQVSGLKKDGSLFPVEVRGKKHWVKGNLLRLVALSDISKRIQYEQSRILYEASQKAIRMRDEFLSIASHELNTPLTNIKIQTQLMLRKILKGDPTVFEPPKIKRFIEQMDTQVNRLVRLVDEMLDVSRISIEKLTFNKEILDLTQLVREVVLSFEGTLSQSGNPVEFVASQAHWVKVDRFRMEQVVSNLLSNAIKYGESKPILIQLDRKTEDVHLSIQDHGIGIPVEIHERIFERFERAVSSNQVSGLGLGLYIAREIIRAHDGRITVESSLREKTCFSVILPLHRFDEINDLPWSSRIKYP